MFTSRADEPFAPLAGCACGGAQAWLSPPEYPGDRSAEWSGPGPPGDLIQRNGEALDVVAARLSAEWAVGVRHGCFCAHPYLIRLLGLGPADVDAYRAQVRAGDHRSMPGAVRASCGISSAVLARKLRAFEVVK